MAMEDVVKKLEAEGDTVALERIKEEAEVGMDGATVGLAEQALARLNEISKKAEDIGVVPAEKIAQVESLGGSGDEIANRTREIDGKIEQVRAETELKVKEVVKGEDAEDKESILGEIEKKKQEIQNQIKLIKMLEDYQEEMRKLNAEARAVLDSNRSAVDVLSYDSEEVQANKKAKYLELTKPFDEKQKQLREKFKENGFDYPQIEQDRLMGTSVWRGEFSDFAKARIQKLEEELVKI